jgi:transcriptional regulator with XRE-family HTH domain
MNMSDSKQIPPELIRRAFGRAVRKHRDISECTQEVLAEKADIHRTYLADIERGARNPSLESIRRIAAALDVPISKLMRVAEDDVQV